MTLTRDEIYRRSTDFYLAPVLPLLDDPGVTEILINGPGEIHFERGGRLFRYDGAFGDEEFLRSAAVNIAEFVERPLDEANPRVDARLPGGSRVNIVMPPLSRQGICISIRKFSESRFDLAGLVERNSLTEQAARFLELAVAEKKNIAIAGGTGTGKTSTLNALSGCIDPAERIIVIEDSSELKLHQPHTLYLEAQPAIPDVREAVTIRDLFVNALRMRPDRIVVGEVRRGEALDMIQAMLAGHDGTLTTVHASTPRAALTRLEILSLQSDVQMPVAAARMMVASAVHLIVQIQRERSGHRCVTHITEVMELPDGGEYRTRDIFRRKRRAASHAEPESLEWTGEVPAFLGEILEDVPAIAENLGFESSSKK